MKIISRAIFLLVFWAFSSVSSRAQNANINICLKDSLGQSLDCANCSVFKTISTVPILSSWSNENGEVSFTLPGDDNYILKVSYMGDLLKELPFSIPKGSDSVELGTLYLNTPMLLDEVVVLGKRVSQKANYIKVNIKGSNLESIGTIMDVLREVPRVVIQGDDIRILGKGTPNIYLNGRRVLNMDEILNLKSSEIKKIEVLTNPNVESTSKCNFTKYFQKRPA